MLVRVHGVGAMRLVGFVAVGIATQVFVSLQMGCGGSSDPSSSNSGQGSTGTVEAPKGALQIDVGCSGGELDAGAGAVVGDTIGFPGYLSPDWSQGDRLQRSRVGNNRWFSKQPIAIRGDTPTAVLRISSASRVVWGGGESGHGSRLVVFSNPSAESCGQADGWQTFPGGFTYRRAQCLYVQVDTGGERATVPFGLGVTCPDDG